MGRGLTVGDGQLLVDVDQVGVGQAIGLNNGLDGNVMGLGQAPNGVAGLYGDGAGTGLSASDEERRGA